MCNLWYRFTQEALVHQCNSKTLFKITPFSHPGCARISVCLEDHHPTLFLKPKINFHDFWQGQASILLLQSPTSEDTFASLRLQRLKSHALENCQQQCFLRARHTKNLVLKSFFCNQPTSWQLIQRCLDAITFFCQHVCSCKGQHHVGRAGQQQLTDRISLNRFLLEPFVCPTLENQYHKVSGDVLKSQLPVTILENQSRLQLTQLHRVCCLGSCGVQKLQDN